MYVVGWSKNLKGSDGPASSCDGRSEGKSTTVLLACIVVKAKGVLMFPVKKMWVAWARELQ